MWKFINATEGKVRYSPYLPVRLSLHACLGWGKEGRRKTKSGSLFLITSEMWLSSIYKAVRKHYRNLQLLKLSIICFLSYFLLLAEEYSTQKHILNFHNWVQNHLMINLSFSWDGAICEKVRSKDARLITAVNFQVELCSYNVMPLYKCLHCPHLHW